ncbi:phosphoenolpyruvate synthase/pyruvate phosphate dikinase [Desulfonema ishimotonii]|uniref:Phosphoenolpyruvate synthase/pyruvate phosphate dikinase n=1 Tax=Desulfonema ishimotonii TaxID=45657 RepID=A0A401FU51_9BACT|nr:PEP/pyruvate-binding domain-containing protein [Desulfonema ishimotonii]GBC60468.1 phosphoenolpyruvate synthase/pyruvate phosphate dikinase [Desulfonema ishimotonii]
MEAKSSQLFSSEFYARFKVFHELMSIKIREILLVSSPYDAFILEEDGSLASRIINEYSGLNLSMPPRVTRTASACDALELLKKKRFDLVITMPHLEEMDVHSFGVAVKKIYPDLPVILLVHNTRDVLTLPQNKFCSGIDKVFVWGGNSDLLLAIVKNVEDDINVDHDTRMAMVRVLLLIEDSPVYRSSFLPLIYKEVVKQTQALLEVGLNEEHRLLLMRARPKILLAETYEQAMQLYHRFHSYLFGIISDARFPKDGKLDETAGVQLLARIRKEIPDLPLLMLSSEPRNRERAEQIPAVFLDKNTSNLLDEIHDFFLHHLGFGDFVFRSPDGKEIDRASNLRTLVEKLPKIPDESVRYHADRNHFSNWVMSRSEIALASQFREVRTKDFRDTDALREYIISNVKALLVWQQKGVVAQFRSHNFDADIMDFVKIGEGSLGGKARGLAFMSNLLKESPELYEKYPDINIQIPKSLVISTEGFEDFVARNGLRHLVQNSFKDDEVTEKFLKGDMPEWLILDLEVFLRQANSPLSIRSSSRLEDAHFQPYAGLYETYMIPNNHPDFSARLSHLITAVKRVFASTYYEGPKAFSKNTANKHHEESMAVIIQEVTGAAHGDYFYPSISGVAQSHNFYPVSHMKPDDGIAYIALGLGKTVVEGGRALRFSPRYPNILPQFSTVDDILNNAQRFFYALRIRQYPEALNFDKFSNLERREIDDAEAELPVKMLASTYVPEEHRIRDSGYMPGPKVLTFASVLKHNILPLPELLSDLLDLGRKAMGCPVEIEFSVNLNPDRHQKNNFYFLQMRPTVSHQDRFQVQITPEDVRAAFCASRQAMGNGKDEEMADIVYVKPGDFKAEATIQMAEEIGKINAALLREKRQYLLVGPGRWGTSDRWLGIPVLWRHISGVRAMVEVKNESLNADPSQGSHFFQNITSLGIFYVTVNEGTGDYFDWEWLDSLPAVQETTFLRHVRTERPILLKADGKTAQCVILRESGENRDEDASSLPVTLCTHV